MLKVKAGNSGLEKQSAQQTELILREINRIESLLSRAIAKNERCICIYQIKGFVFPLLEINEQNVMPSNILFFFNFRNFAIHTKKTPTNKNLR